MIRVSIACFCLLLLSACTSNYPLKSVDYNDLISCGNSKVWVMNKMTVNNVNVAPHDLGNKDVLIFHVSGVVDYLPLKAIGERDPRKGRYYLDSDKRTLSITFDHETWLFKLSVLEEDKIVMKPNKKGSAPFTAELIPLPEL